MRAMLAFQHVLITLAALGAAVALAWHGTLNAGQVQPIIAAALLYGLGGQALKNGQERKPPEE